MKACKSPSFVPALVNEILLMSHFMASFDSTSILLSFHMGSLQSLHQTFYCNFEACGKFMTILN